MSTAAGGGDQPRGEVVCARCARGGRVEHGELRARTLCTRDRQPAPPHGLLPRVQRCQQNSWGRACGGDNLRAAFVIKCYDERRADALLRMGLGEEHQTVACSRGVQQGDRMGPAMFYLSLRQGLKRFVWNSMRQRR